MPGYAAEPGVGDLGAISRLLTKPNSCYSVVTCHFRFQVHNADAGSNQTLAQYETFSKVHRFYLHSERVHGRFLQSRRYHIYDAAFFQR